ncbi:MAG: hypothetical protein PHP86_11020 [Nevskiales bacterium]|nr:hypothetical protein [Nevskiales bacterium]
MSAAGRIDIEIDWDGHCVGDVAVESRRPHAARLLIGRRCAEAVSLVPMLFSICGRAQGLCAQLATGTVLTPSPDQRLGLCAERVLEHLWRLWLDWPALFQVAARRDEFAEVGGALRRCADADTARTVARAVDAALRRQNRGLGLDEVLEALAAGRTELLFDGWLQQLAALDRPLPAAVAPLCEGALAEWVGRLPAVDAAFAARPSCDGQPAEVGAITVDPPHPAVAALSASQRPLTARIAARIAALQRDLRELGGAPAAGAATVPACERLQLDGRRSLARVATARGPLLHAVTLDGDGVADYQIVAPTEWNFHPRGALVAALQGLDCADAAALRRHAAAWVLALDPCVPHRLALRGDGAAG